MSCKIKEFVSTGEKIMYGLHGGKPSIKVFIYY